MNVITALISLACLNQFKFSQIINFPATIHIRGEIAHFFTDTMALELISCLL